MPRLESVFGVGGWKDSYQLVAGGSVGTGLARSRKIQILTIVNATPAQAAEVDAALTELARSTPGQHAGAGLLPLFANGALVKKGPRSSVAGGPRPRPDPTRDKGCGSMAIRRLGLSLLCVGLSVGLVARQ